MEPRIAKSYSFGSFFSSLFNRAEKMGESQRLQPLRAKDAPQRLKPPLYRPWIGTTEVVPLQDSEEVMQQLLDLFPCCCIGPRRGQP